MTDAPIEREHEGAWAKLRHRKVVQWGLAYAAGAWALLQVIGFAADTFDWPRLIQQLAAIGLVVGLPVVLVVAWYHGDRGQQRASGAELAILSVLLVLGGGALWLYGQRHRQAPVSSTPPAAPTVAQDSSVVSADDRPSIAVLPFENRSRLDDDAFFVDGIHDDILTQLSKVSALKVISRTSVEKFHDTQLSTREIAGQLGVQSILEGGVQRAGDRVRINVQLIDAETDAHLWAESYDRELTTVNIFAIQSEVAAAITGALKATLTTSEKARSEAMPTRSLEAWESYQLGRQRLAKRTISGFTEAEGYFRKAIELDPSFALAYSGLADALLLSLDYTGAPRPAALEQARAAAYTAVELDPGLADAWASAGLTEWEGDHRDRAEEMFRRAIELNPNHATALKFYGGFLFDDARIDESVRYLERAAGLDPLSAMTQISLGQSLAAQGRFEDAAVRYRRAIEIDPLMPIAYSSLAGLTAYYMNDFVNAVPLEEKTVALDPDFLWGRLGLAMMYCDLGYDTSCDRAWREAERRWPENALVNWVLGMRDLQGGDRNGAMRRAGRVLETNHRDSGALGLLGFIDYRSGRYAEAVARYRKAYPELFTAAPSIDQGNYTVAIDIVAALQKLDKTDEALVLLAGSEKVMSRLPLLGGGLKWEGRATNDARALALRGRKQEALAALRAAEQAGWRGWAWRWVRDFQPALDAIREEPEFEAIFADIERDMARQRAELAKRPKDASFDPVATH